MITNVIIKPRDSGFKLILGNLKPGKFYECENGTVVFVGRGDLGHENPLNVENGMGGYGIGDKFRLITPKEFTFEF